MKILIRLLVSALAVLITTFILPGVAVDGFLTAALVAVVLSLLNTFLKPIFIILTIPLTILTFGIFLLVINALIIILTAALVPGFDVDGFWWALIFGLILSLIMSVLDAILEDKF